MLRKLTPGIRRFPQVCPDPTRIFRSSLLGFRSRGQLRPQSSDVLTVPDLRNPAIVEPVEVVPAQVQPLGISDSGRLPAHTVTRGIAYQRLTLEWIDSVRREIAQ